MCAEHCRWLTAMQSLPGTEAAPEAAARTLYVLRISMMLLISTSLNVDSMAYVFWAPFRRSATRCRRRVIFTRLQCADRVVDPVTGHMLHTVAQQLPCSTSPGPSHVHMAVVGVAC